MIRVGLCVTNWHRGLGPWWNKLAECQEEEVKRGASSAKLVVIRIFIVTYFSYYFNFAATEFNDEIMICKLIVELRIENAMHEYWIDVISVLNADGLSIEYVELHGGGSVTLYQL